MSPLTFNIANGKTTATHQAPLYCKEIWEYLLPHVLESTPPVLSAGKRCMDMGYSFVWMQGKNPHWICPNGMIVELEVRDNIPCLKGGSSDCQPKVASDMQPIPVAVHSRDDSGEEIDVDPLCEPVAAEVDTDDSAWESDEIADAPEAKRDLKAEAKTIEHLLNHKVKNPHCDSCNRSTMKNKRSMTGAFKDEPTAWGDLVTGDHLDSKRRSMIGFSGKRRLLLSLTFSLGFATSTLLLQRTLLTPP